MKSYDLCKGWRYLEYEDFDGYKKGMVYNSSAPSDCIAEYKTESEAKQALARRKSYVHPKGNGYEIVEYYIIEYDCHVDSDGDMVANDLGKLIDIAKLEEKDRVLEILKASYHKERGIE